MCVGSFLAGLFLGGHRSSIPVYEYNATIISNPIQYPDDWDDYTVEKKLEWLKNRSYWHEYYELKHSLHERVEFKLVEGDNIYHKVVDSIIRNKGDTTEANQLFTEYLNEGYMGKVLNNTTRDMLAMEVDRMNDYIRQNYPSISQFGKPVENYHFDVRLE